MLGQFYEVGGADVMCIQEHKILGTHMPYAKEHGWRYVSASAVATAGGGMSAGVAVLARSHIPLGEIDGPLPFDDHPDKELYAGRFVAAIVSAGPSRSTVVVSTYFWSGESWSPRNLTLASRVAAWLHSLNRPYIWGPIGTTAQLSSPTQECSAATIAGSSRLANPRCVSQTAK